MRTRSASLWLAAAFTLLGTGTAAAQQAPRALEFGGDLLAAYSFTSGGVRSSGVALPAGVVRMGIQVSERLSLETPRTRRFSTEPRRAFGSLPGSGCTTAPA